MILMLKYVEKSLNVLKFQHHLPHNLRFQKEKKKKKRPKLKTHTHKDKNMRTKQSVQKQKDLNQTPATTPSLTHYYIFLFWWIRLLFCHSCPVLAKSRTEHVTGSPPNPPTLQLSLIAKKC